MNFAAVFHVSDYSFVQVQSDGSITIKLKVGSDDNIDKINLIHGNPFFGVKDEDGNWNWIKEATKMNFMGKGEFHSYYIINIKPKDKRIRYFFEIINKDEIIYYGEKGFSSNPNIIKDNFFGFSYPYIHKSDSYNPPKWLEKTIWYQIFPDRFNNGNMDNDQEGALSWNESLPTARTFFGGDLEGIINKLDYLKDLGISGIYINPIFTSPSTHKYDTVDYYEIDPHFGTKEDLKLLVKEAHERGIKVILDAVFNHSSNEFFAFKDVLKKQEKSKYKDWFYLKKFPISLDGDLSYETFAFVRNMPKLNVENEECANYLIDVATYWIKETDIDGYRVDVANEQPHDFYRKLRRKLKLVKEDAVLIAESWSNSSIWLYGDQFDSVMNYMFTNLVIDYLVKKQIDTNTFIKRYIDIYHIYPTLTSRNLFNLLDSHDTSRIITLCGNDLNKVMIAYTLLFTYNGTPCIYYGGEIGLEGKEDPDCRRCMIWDESKWDSKLNEFIKKLIYVRNIYQEIFINGNIEIMSKNNMIIITRTLNNDIITTYLNIYENMKLEPTDEVLVNEAVIKMVKTSK